MDWRNSDRELRPPGAALVAPAARDEVGDAVVGAELVPQRQEIDIGVVAAPDRVAGDPHLQAVADSAADGADLGGRLRLPFGIAF